MVSFFERHSAYGILVLRLLIGVRLLWGVADNVVSWEHMVEFEKFLAQRGVPMTLFAALISVYAQFFASLCFILGAFVRPAAVVMIVNFIAALVIAHRGDSFVGSYQALTMLCGSLALLFLGAGPASIEQWTRRRRQR
jgi:putative oxidoreductase